MKQFLKYTLAVVTGLVLTACLFGLVGALLLAGIAASADRKPTLSDGSVLHVQLKGLISDRHEDTPWEQLLGGGTLQQQGLATLRQAISVAATNPKIKGIYLEAGLTQADPATLQELRRLISEFKRSGKFVLAYGDSYSSGAYYVASAANRVLINPSGMIDWHGMAAMPVFYKDLLEKVGVRMQVFRVGTYKSYVEPYTRTEMSRDNREQLRAYLDDVWDGIKRETAASRHLPPSALDSVANGYAAFDDPSQYVARRLVDSLCYIDGAREQLRRLAGSEQVHLVSATDLARLYETPSADARIAVYYLSGQIVDEPIGAPGSEVIVGQQVVDDLDRLAQDDHVKAVVLRINSGGGSAYASEQMWRALQLLKRKKPVVVSMSGAAASGAYYLACGANRIVAMPSTVTGSIGIFGLIPDVSPLLTEKLGLHNDVVKTNRASDFGNPFRPFNAAESQALQAYVDRGYALFLRRVAQGRKMTVAQIDRIAQGRVWTGRQALRLGLVDRLGNLDDAIGEAARLAKVSDFGTDLYPAPKGWMDSFLDDARESYMERELQEALGVYYEPLRLLKNLQHTGRLQALMPFSPVGLF